MRDTNSKFIVIIYSSEFFSSALADGISLEFEWQQVSSSLPSILAILNNVVVWMVSTRPPTSKPTSPFSDLFVIIHSLELFTSALADGFSLESEWQQVSSSLQDSS